MAKISNFCASFWPLNFTLDPQPEKKNDADAATGQVIECGYQTRTNHT